MWDLRVIDVSQPLYIAIADALERDIRTGVLQAGDLLPTQRELAKKVGIAISTATRAYSEAARRNLIIAIVGKGTFVAGDAGVAPSLVNATNKEKPLIELGLVHPLLSKERYLDEVTASVLGRNDLENLVASSSPQGQLLHRKTASEWMRRMGVEADINRIAITAGTRHALCCIFSSLFKPGDRIAVDSLTYPGVKSAARQNGIRLEAVAMDSCGMLPSSLDALCHRHEIKGIYASGNIQNPTNFNMTAERRKDIVAVIEKRKLLLVEDDVYGFLASTPSPLAALVPDRCIYIASLAKAFYPGLRVAFVAVPPPLYGKVTQSIVDTIGITPPLCVEIACETIRSGFADKIINSKKRELARRIALFKKKMGGYTYYLAEPNMFAWLKLPEPWTSVAFKEAARDSGVSVIEAERFAVGHNPPPAFVRISLSAVNTVRTFSTGLDILRGVLEQRNPSEPQPE